MKGKPNLNRFIPSLVKGMYGASQELYDAVNGVACNTSGDAVSYYCGMNIASSGSIIVPANENTAIICCQIQRHIHDIVHEISQAVEHEKTQCTDKECVCLTTRTVSMGDAVADTYIVRDQNTGLSMAVALTLGYRQQQIEILIAWQISRIEM